jgi:hypothetical protein
MLTALKNITLVSIIALYSIEGITYGSYALDLFQEAAVRNTSKNQANNLPSNIRPIWTQKKHISEGKKSFSPYITGFSFLSEKEFFHCTSYILSDYGLIAHNIYFENLNRAPPLI